MHSSSKPRLPIMILGIDDILTDQEVNDWSRVDPVDTVVKPRLNPRGTKARIVGKEGAAA